MNDWRRPDPVELSPILAHSLAAFYEAGYHGATIRDIAGRVGVNIPAIYYRHENKEAILIALLDLSIERFMTLSDAALAEAGNDPALRFLYVIEAVARHMAQSRELAFLDPEVRALSPDARRDYYAKRRAVELRVRSVVEGAADAGLLTTPVPKATARALLAMLRGIAVWFRPDGLLGIDEVATQSVFIAARAAGATAQLLKKIPMPSE